MSSPIYPDADSTAQRQRRSFPSETQNSAERSVNNDALIKLKILTPLAVLLSLASNLIANLAIKPSVGRISDSYLTAVTPRKTLIEIYWLVLYALQIGYAILVTTARKEVTKRTIVSAVGQRFVFAVFLFALWPIFWVTRLFVVAEVFLFIIFLLLLSIYFSLLRYPPTTHRPFDLAFIHVSVRLFLLALWNLDIWQNGSMGLGWFKYTGADPDGVDHPGQWEKSHEQHVWITFGILLAVGLIDAVVIFLSKDIVWALATVYLFVSVLVGPSSESGPTIAVPLVLLSVLQVAALAASFGWSLFARHRDGREGTIRLPADAGERTTSDIPA